MSKNELKIQGDLAVKNFKAKLNGLSLEEEMKPKWRAMALESTQKKIALSRQNTRF